MKVKLLFGTYLGGVYGHTETGKVVDLEEPQAKELIAMNKAEEFVEASAPAEPAKKQTGTKKGDE